MKPQVRIPIMIQDPLTAQRKGLITLTENVDIDREDFFLDGPVTRRVAVLDFDPADGSLAKGARYKPPPAGRVRGSYHVPTAGGSIDIASPGFLAVSVFGTVLKTMTMFEEEDALGRELRWAFDAPQLLVVPRAGEWANAFYQRESHSLQFFFVSRPDDPREKVYTGLSRDIVAHETGHAILDGIAPDLYNALTPQSLALHEAIADLTALLMAIRSPTLRDAVLRQAGSIEDTTAFTRIAEEFGQVIPGQGSLRSLRDVKNRRTLDPNDTSVDADGRPNRVARNEPHRLSEVLTGALYEVLTALYHEHLALTRSAAADELAAAGRALGVSADHFKRMIFRALDYLPPGEVTFADYGRAIIAADQASHPDTGLGRERLKDELGWRKMVARPADLDVQAALDSLALADVNVEALRDSDWAAYDFANRQRALLRIPEGQPFRVWPRLDATKVSYHGRGEKVRIRECIFKVSWDVEEPNRAGRELPARRQLTAGTTLAIAWPESGPAWLRFRLTSDLGSQTAANDQQRRDRDLMLARLIERDQLAVGDAAVGLDGRRRHFVVRAETSNDVMRIRDSARLLHIAPEVS
jgi:hypothetical protein